MPAGVVGAGERQRRLGREVGVPAGVVGLAAGGYSSRCYVYLGALRFARIHLSALDGH